MIDKGIQDHSVKILVSPFLRTVQTGAHLSRGLFDQYYQQDYFIQPSDQQEEKIAQDQDYPQQETKSDKSILPIIFISTNLSNRLSGKKQHLFDIGELAKNSLKPEGFIEQYCDNNISSYHLNQIGNTHLFYPGVIEEKSVFNIRIAQGSIDIIIEHFINMVHLKRQNQILILVSHHKAIQQFMRILDKSQLLNDKPGYCWTIAVEL